MALKIKRAYEKPSKSDGSRILVDRLWPRGISKEEAKVDLWLKELSPSEDLRKWFDHKEENWQEFERRYNDELDKNEPAVSKLEDALKDGDVTLLYAAKDQEHNNAMVILNRFKKSS